MRKNRFTLLELISIVATLLLFAAAALPVAIRAAGVSGTTACLAKLKCLNVGLMQYTADNSDYFPAGPMMNHQTEWASRIAPYLGVKREKNASAAAFSCPDDSASAKLTYGDLLNCKSSYGLNGYGVCWDHQTGKGVKRAQVKNPDMILLADADGWLIVGYAGEGKSRIPVPRHEEGKAVNVLHFDGRVDTVKVKLSTPADMYNDENLPSAYWHRTL